MSEARAEHGRQRCVQGHEGEGDAHRVPHGALVAGVVIEGEQVAGDEAGCGVRAMAVQGHMCQKTAIRPSRGLVCRAPHAVHVPAQRYATLSLVLQ